MKMPPIDIVQKRIVNISVGTSTVRGQPEGTVITARKYLQYVNLKDFSEIINEDGFKGLLDKHTQLLKERLPSKSWGIARKVMNIFLFQATHDIILNRNYTLDKIIPYLELPLDNPNAKRLKKFAKSEGITLEWRNIYSLQPEVSITFQNYAKQYAQEKYNCERCYLDVYWWRSEDDVVV